MRTSVRNEEIGNRSVEDVDGLESFKLKHLYRSAFFFLNICSECQLISQCSLYQRKSLPTPTINLCELFEIVET